jgi:IS605 OrfB family transposase
VSQALHRVSTLIVEKARANKEAIVLERLKGIRYAHQRGNGEGKARRRRIALWPFRQLQSYIDYKAKWAGVPVGYVSPAYTSKKCHVCGVHQQEAESYGQELPMPSMWCQARPRP